MQMSAWLENELFLTLVLNLFLMLVLPTVLTASCLCCQHSLRGQLCASYSLWAAWICVAIRICLLVSTKAAIVTLLNHQPLIIKQ